MSDPAAALTVCVPTLDRPGLLAECLASLLDQGLAAGELVVSVSDNGANPETVAAVDRFRDRLTLRYRRRPASGTHVENLNELLDGVETPFVSILCDDDLVAPGQLGRALRCLRQRPQAAAYVALGLGQRGFGDPAGELLGSLLDPQPVEGEPFLFRWTARSWLARCSLGTPATIIGSVFRREALPPLPLFSAEFPTEGDRLLFLRLIEQGELYTSPWVGGHVRRHGEQISQRRTEAQREETAQVTQAVFDAAERLGHDLAAHWVEVLPRAGEQQLAFLCGQIWRNYPRPVAKRIFAEAGVDARWRALREERKRQRRGPRRGLVETLRRLLP